MLPAKKHFGNVYLHSGNKYSEVKIDNSIAYTKKLPGTEA